VTLRTYAQLIAALGLLTIVPAAVEAANGHQDNAVTTSAAVASTGGSNGTAVTNAGQQTPPGQQLPTNLVAPGITGTAAIGKVLTASSGSWDGNSLTYTFQWQRCATDGTGCGPIASAVGSTYTVSSADVGRTLRVAVTATNHNGSATASSAPTTVAAPPPAPAPTTTTTTTTTTTSSAGGTVMFDGRAKNMSTLYSYESTPGSLSTLQQAQVPALWDCLCYMDNSISLAADATFGKVFHTVVGPGDRNPWNTGAPTNDAAAQLSKRKSTDLGKWNWYAFAVTIPSGGWSNPDWATIVSLNYETISADQDSIVIYPSSTGPQYWLYQNTGLLTKNSGGFYQGSTSGRIAQIAPVVYGQTLEFVVGLKNATDNTGAVEIYTRSPGGAWQHPVERLNTPTLAYGTTSYTTCDAQMSQCTTNLDKVGLYYGYWNTATTSFPTETINVSGLSRASDLATAQSLLP
jgi:hypothetical protein